jgi:hypothetical protein
LSKKSIYFREGYPKNLKNPKMDEALEAVCENFNSGFLEIFFEA